MCCVCTLLGMKPKTCVCQASDLPALGLHLTSSMCLSVIREDFQYQISTLILPNLKCWLRSFNFTVFIHRDSLKTCNSLAQILQCLLITRKVKSFSNLVSCLGCKLVNYTLSHIYHNNKFTLKIFILIYQLNTQPLAYRSKNSHFYAIVLLIIIMMCCTLIN